MFITISFVLLSQVNAIFTDKSQALKCLLVSLLQIDDVNSRYFCVLESSSFGAGSLGAGGSSLGADGSCGTSVALSDEDDVGFIEV